MYTLTQSKCIPIALAVVLSQLSSVVHMALHQNVSQSCTMFYLYKEIIRKYAYRPAWENKQTWWYITLPSIRGL